MAATVEVVVDAVALLAAAGEVVVVAAVAAQLAAPRAERR